MPQNAVSPIPGTVTISGLDPLIWEEVIHELRSAERLYRLVGLTNQADEVERHIQVLNWHAIHAA